MEKKFTFIDLFAGIGGFRIALKSIGGDCVNFSEINTDSINTYCTNFSESKNRNLGDITKIENLPKHDLLTAGVPCQSWSIAGKNMGFDDDRGQLWNDTIYLLNKSKPKAFIFENVKGLVDPRNKDALLYILKRIKDAGYFAKYFVLNSFDYGVPQNRVRIYIVGFRDEKICAKFDVHGPLEEKMRLNDIIAGCNTVDITGNGESFDKDLFGSPVALKRKFSLSNTSGLNDYFLFNDIRNGHTTIHSWDIVKTTNRQKKICLLLLRNRRKGVYGNLDGNPLSLSHFKNLDNTITQSDLNGLVDINILKEEIFSYKLTDAAATSLSDEEKAVLSHRVGGNIIPDVLFAKKDLKIKKVSISKTIDSLVKKGLIRSNEIRYDFKNTKISTGLFGVNRIFLSSSNIFPTLVASDTNDYISPVSIIAKNEDDYRKYFIEEVYNKSNYRKITKSEACRVQGFPEDFILPENRSRWMRLIGNSVSIPVIKMLGRAILETGAFN